MKVRIPKDVIKKGREFARQVWSYRGQNPDKFLLSENQSAELAADTKGFMVEFAHCFAFKQPYPKIFQGKEVDKFDCYMTVPNENGLLQLLKFDVKTSAKFLINKDQLRRKSVDAYLFEALEFEDWQNDITFLKIHGWILKKAVKENSELVKFPNGSEAYRVDKKALKKPGELFALNQAGGI